jgi:deazaflavin-dependent oxidoreductase (nitroreductase family)
MALFAPGARPMTYNTPVTETVTGAEMADLLRRLCPGATVRLGGRASFAGVAPVMDGTQARDDIGFVPEISFEEGMRRMIEHYRMAAGRSVTLVNHAAPPQRARTEAPRVEHEGRYALVAADPGGADAPWHADLLANPHVRLLDGPDAGGFTARLLDGAERAAWWHRAIRAVPLYAVYQARSPRLLPLFLLPPI